MLLNSYLSGEPLSQVSPQVNLLRLFQRMKNIEMGFAPLAFLRGKQPPRTVSWHENPSTFSSQGGRTFAIDYYTPTPPGAYFSRQTFPVRLKDKNDELQGFHPPPHYHLLQDEYFKVESGAGIWHLNNGKTIRLKAGDEIVVPALKYHWFENDPASDEQLAVLYRYDREYAEMEERFFRNTFGYMQDCRRAGIEMSVIQLIVFCMHNWMPLGLVAVGPEWVHMILNTIIMAVVGCFGEFMLGYKSSYSEYYREQSEKL